jgi:murein DD-endopeptidase MepM/ murein hydrolase activator NlpD
LIARAIDSPPPPTLVFLPLSVPQTTPTPLIYTIQIGDTLLGISRRFGIPIDSLTEANGDLNPLALAIGSQMIIPSPAFDANGSPILPTSTPGALALRAPNCYPTSTDSILCLGQLTNNTFNPVERVVLSIGLLRRDGSLLGQVETGIAMRVIPGGQSAPYAILAQADWRDYAGVTVSLRSADVAIGLNLPIELTLENEHGALVNGTYRVSATLRNPHAQASYIRQVILTLENHRGELVGYRVLKLDQRLESGSIFNLHISAIPQSLPPARHRLYIEVEPAS